jgi:hypothetical protein
VEISTNCALWLSVKAQLSQSSPMVRDGLRPPHHEGEQFRPSGVNLMVSLSNHEPCERALFRHLIVAHGDFEQEALGARLVYELGESARLRASLAPFLGVWLGPQCG